MVADIVAAKSRLILQAAYGITRNELVAQIDSLVGEKNELDDELAKLTDKGREKAVKTVWTLGRSLWAVHCGTWIFASLTWAGVSDTPMWLPGMRDTASARRWRPPGRWTE